MNEREHIPYHERRLEQQMLDALLRIEEILADLRAAGANGPPAVFTAAAEVIEEAKPAQRGKRK